MSQELIFYPAIAMFALTMFVLFKTGIARNAAVTKRKVDIRFYELYRDDEQEPDELRVLGRHLQNHFEVPPLFYFVVLALYVTEQVSMLSLIGAWLFVGFRIAHTAVHLGGNIVLRRFLVFIASTVSLMLLWAYLFLGLLVA